MLDFMNKAEVAVRIHDSIQGLCHDEEQGIDGMKELLLLCGMMVETAFLFDNCEDALPESFDKLSALIACEPLGGPVSPNALPPSTIIDFDTEQGRALAREYFEEWLDCPYEFHEMLLFLIQQTFMRWEAQGQPRAESFRLLVEGTHLAMAYELAAQELCDAVIETKIGVNGWSLADSVNGMAGMAGRKLAASHDGKNQCCWFRGTDLPDFLDQTAYVMTQEAVRLGLCTGPEWRFGLPANDVPSNPPTMLIQGMETICRGFFQAINMADPADQAVACAKAAGRMLAVAAGGRTPEMEPAIAKPLAMCALTESYKSVCVEYAAVL